MKTQLREMVFSLGFFLAVTGCNLVGGSTTTYNNATVTGGESVDLNWSAATGIIVGYKIEESTDNVNFTPALTVGNVTSSRVSGLNAQTTYYFRVRAYNQGGSSDPTTSVSATTGGIVSNTSSSSGTSGT